MREKKISAKRICDQCIFVLQLSVVPNPILTHNNVNPLPRVFVYERDFADKFYDNTLSQDFVG